MILFLKAAGEQQEGGKKKNEQCVSNAPRCSSRQCCSCSGRSTSSTVVFNRRAKSYEIRVMTIY